MATQAWLPSAPVAGRAIDRRALPMAHPSGHAWTPASVPGGAQADGGRPQGPRQGVGVPGQQRPSGQIQQLCPGALTGAPHTSNTLQTRVCGVPGMDILQQLRPFLTLQLPLDQQVATRESFHTCCLPFGRAGPSEFSGCEVF